MRYGWILLGALANPAHGAAQRVEALDVLDRALLPMSAPNAGSTAVVTRGRLVSGDGRFVLVGTRATDLDATIEDLNGESDVWLIDREAAAPRLLSRSAGNAAATANGASRPVALSRDGRRALFASTATDLVAGQTDGNAAEDLFLYDLDADSVILVSRRVPGSTATPDGASTDGLLDGSGRRVVFRTAGGDVLASSPIVDDNGADDTYLLDLSVSPPSLRLLSHVDGSNVQAGNARSIPTAISLDGRYVTMLSGADAMVPGQLAGSGEQILLEDRGGGTRRLVTHAAGNPVQESNGTASSSAFSDDNRILVFGSAASNLVAGVTDTNGGCDIFVHDLASGANALVTSSAASASATGNQGGNCTGLPTADGSRVAFASNATNLVAGLTDVNGSGSDVFVQVLATRARQLVSMQAGTPAKTANAASSLLDIDDEGKHVLFDSRATDLVAGQADTANTVDLFVRRSAEDDTRLLTRRHDDGDAAIGLGGGGRLAADGSAILLQATDAIDATDDNLSFDVYLERDKELSRLTHGDPKLDDRPTDGGFGTALAQGIDASGRYVAFSSAGQRLRADTGGAATSQLWLRDRLDDSLELVTHAVVGENVRAAGQHGPVALSADGEWLAYRSTSSELVAAGGGTPGAAQVYLWHRSTRSTRLVSHAAGAPGVYGNAPSDGALRISADGRFVAFTGRATNLVAGQTGAANDNLFLYDRDTGVTRLVSHAAAGATQAAGGVGGSFALSADGSALAFASFAADIAGSVPDTNGSVDVFLHVVASGENVPVSRSRSSARMAAGGSLEPDVSADGSRVVFTSASNELLPGPPTLGTSIDVFLWTRTDDSVRLLTHHPSNAAQPSNGNASQPQIDDAGRRVVFLSTATDLVPGFSTPHAFPNLFLSDLAGDTVFLLGHAAGNATQAVDDEVRVPVLARDGSAVAFVTRATNVVANQVDAGGQVDVFRTDLATRSTVLASHRLGQPNVAALPNVAGAALAPGVSGNGLLVSFGTQGADLVAHDVGGNNAFVYVHDEPVRATITAVEPEAPRAGEPYVVRVELDVARGPAVGRVAIDDGAASCQFDIAAADDNRGACALVTPVPGAYTLTARFTSPVGFAESTATREITVLPPPRADLSIALSAPATVATGAGFTLQTHIANAGPDAAGDVRLVFSGLPDLLAASGAGWSCVDVTCTLAALAAGATAPLALTLAAPDEDTLLALQASVGSALVDPATGDNAANAAVQVDGAPAITQVSPPGGNTEGGYPLQVSGANFGSAPGQVKLGPFACTPTLWTPTQIVCTVPPGAGVHEVEVIQAATALDRTRSAAFAYDAPEVDAIAPAVGAPEGGYPMTVTGRNFGANGASVTIAGLPCGGVQHDGAQPHRRLACTVPAGTGANLPVVVTQSGRSSDGADRYAYASVVADLLIDKSSARSEVFARGVDEWTLLVSNLGPDRADGARVVDVLPPHLEAVSWTCLGLAGAHCGASQGTGDIDLALALPAGGSALLQVVARIPRAPLIDVVNSARVQAPGGIVDPQPGNDTDVETDPMATIFFDDFETF